MRELAYAYSASRRDDVVREPGVDPGLAIRTSEGFRCEKSDSVISSGQKNNTVVCPSIEKVRKKRGCSTIVVYLIIIDVWTPWRKISTQRFDVTSPR